MRVGVPTELKNHEYRVALTPAGAHELVAAGHDVIVQGGAGEGSSIPDDAYRDAGASIAPDAEAVWSAAELVLKVKEPVGPEYALMRPDQVLFTYLHLAASRACTDAILASGTTAIAYETVQLADGSLPLLAPMSEVAGRLAAHEGAHHLLRPQGGRGVLMSGVPGVRPADVVVIGGGVSGLNAAIAAARMNADVTLLDLDVAKLRTIDRETGGSIRTVASSTLALEEAVLRADLVIGAVLLPGARAPQLVSNDLVSRIRRGSVLVDISIDQGGCFEDSRPTTHDEPTFRVHGSVFYCVANMPGAVPHTSTHALTNVTLPYVAAIAGQGWHAALAADPGLALGLNAHRGELTSRPVAAAHGLAHRRVEEVLS